MVTLRLLRPLKFVIVALVDESVLASTVPVTLKLVRPVRFVIFAFVAVKVVALIVLIFVRFVIEFCALGNKVPLKFPPVIVPVTFKSLKLPVVALTVAA